MFVAKRLPKPTDTQALGTIIPVPLQAKCPCSVHSIKWMSTPPQECTRPVSTIGSAHTGPGSRHPPPLRWLANGHDLVLIESLHCKPIQSLVSTVETHKTVREAYSYTQGPLVPFPERPPGLQSPSANPGHRGRLNPSSKHATLRSFQEEHAQASPICMAQDLARASAPWQPGHLSLDCY